MVDSVTIVLKRRTVLAPTPGLTGSAPPDGAKAAFGSPGDQLEVLEKVRNGSVVWFRARLLRKDGSEKGAGWVIHVALVGQMPPSQLGKLTNG